MNSTVDSVLAWSSPSAGSTTLWARLQQSWRRLCPSVESNMILQKHSSKNVVLNNQIRVNFVFSVNNSATVRQKIAMQRESVFVCKILLTSFMHFLVRFDYEKLNVRRTSWREVVSSFFFVTYIKCFVHYVYDFSRQRNQTLNQVCLSKLFMNSTPNSVRAWLSTSSGQPFSTIVFPQGSTEKPKSTIKTGKKWIQKLL